MSKISDKITAYKMTELHKLLNQCTEEEEAKFDRMYGSRDTIPEDRIDWAIYQCERTIEKRKEQKDK